MARKSSIDSEINKLRDQLLRDLAREGEQIVKQMTQQFSSDLQSQSAQMLQSLGSVFSGAGGDGGDMTALARLFGNAVGLAVRRPHISTSSQETARSKEAEERFRLSQSQLLAETGVKLSKGEKNL